LWQADELRHPRYGDFKSRLYGLIDPPFRNYFGAQRVTDIRLDEVVWGGVRQDGIPPLRYPKMIRAAEATYLADSDIVFGIAIGDDVRAYPKRILAWHEMARDTIGEQNIALVYCTLCGTVIPYKTQVNGTQLTFGTSGLLYRSNKLMYDHGTKSMWSTIRGAPVIGALVGKGIELQPLYVVTTTWGKWKQLHPETDVLSLRTGHTRDYGEGVAYRRYFATDRLMFTVPKLDGRLKNKDEVLIIRNEKNEPLALSTRFLASHPVYQDSVAGEEFVVLTDASGASRVYRTQGQKFSQMQSEGKVVTDSGRVWRMTEEELVAEGADSGEPDVLPRAPAHRAFWFGWQAVFPDTRLVK